MRRLGLIFVLAALTKIWLSVYLTDFYLLRMLEINGSLEGDWFSNTPITIWLVVAIELIIGLVLIFLKGENKR